MNGGQNPDGEKPPEAAQKGPAFYAIVPATVRYDAEIPDGAKLLFAEITSLCSKEGFCWAGNAYFSRLYKKNERTIRNWINALKDRGYITASYQLVPGTREIASRHIRLAKPLKTRREEKKAPENVSESPPGEPENTREEQGEVGKKFFPPAPAPNAAWNAARRRAGYTTCARYTPCRPENAPNTSRGRRRSPASADLIS